MPDNTVQVVAKPDEDDRITDQMVENPHGAALGDRQLVHDTHMIPALTIPSLTPAATAAVRDWTSSFRRMLLTCRCTVRSLK